MVGLNFSLFIIHLYLLHRSGVFFVCFRGVCSGCLCLLSIFECIDNEFLIVVYMYIFSRVLVLNQPPVNGRILMEDVCAHFLQKRLFELELELYIQKDSILFKIIQYSSIRLEFPIIFSSSKIFSLTPGNYLRQDDQNIYMDITETIFTQIIFTK